ncbi:MAG: hypothetical protein AAF573_02310 [Bacteroidota bacterium]
MRILLYLTIFLSVPFCLISQESNAFLCGDGIDNDGDNLIDCDDPDCANINNNDDGCSTCHEGVTFADVLIEYIPGCPLADPDPSGAIGVSDWPGTNGDDPSFVFLGQGGSIKLGFTNNLLTNSGDSDPDLWVFEIGTVVEASEIELRPLNSDTEIKLQNNGITDSDSDGFYDFGIISGSTTSLDIDGLITGCVPGDLQFDAIEITDVDDGSCSGGTPGADIDAVCALSNIATEICFNGLDDDGDGSIDEDCELCEFDNNLVNRAIIDGNACVKGAISIGEVIELKPLQSPPSNPKRGTMYFDNTSSKLRVWDGNQWQDCF